MSVGEEDIQKLLPDKMNKLTDPYDKEGEIRTFDTGATRDTDKDKMDYEGFLSPLVIQRYGEYMHKNRIQADGTLRASDNWQKGIPPSQYMKSLWRHFLDLWVFNRLGVPIKFARQEDEFIEEACCGIMFNVMGYLHEHLKGTE